MREPRSLGQPASPANGGIGRSEERKAEVCCSGRRSHSSDRRGTGDPGHRDLACTLRVVS